MEEIKEEMDEEIMRFAEAAREIGFDGAHSLDVSTLHVREDVRAMCAEDKCHAYGHNWTCPPECGTLEDCQKRMESHRYGVLVQTIGHLSKTIDTKGYMETEKTHRLHFQALCEKVRAKYPDALCLGAGGCRVCGKCNYPGPCRFPEKAVSSMEAYGLFVTQVCRDNGVDYYYGPKTIAYTSCILFG